jgi:hypothetical protein
MAELQRDGEGLVSMAMQEAVAARREAEAQQCDLSWLSSQLCTRDFQLGEEGAGGRVFECQNPATGVWFAVKLIPRAGYDDVAHSFQREVFHTSKLPLYY